MAEAIQKKLNAEVEKYTQMQKGLCRLVFLTIMCEAMLMFSIETGSQISVHPT